MNEKMINEEVIAEAFLNGNDEIIEEENYVDIDAASLHEIDKANVAHRRKAEFKHKHDIQPHTSKEHRKEKKLFKKSSSKRNRRAKEIVNGKRGLYHKLKNML